MIRLFKYLFYSLSRQILPQVIQSEPKSPQRVRHNVVCQCVHVCMHTYSHMSEHVKCMPTEEHRESLGKGDLNTVPEPSVTACMPFPWQCLKTHCPLRETPSLTSHITAQGQGREWRDSPGVGCLLLDVFRRVPLAVKVTEGPSQRVPWEP